jgi:hypothetical protein
MIEGVLDNEIVSEKESIVFDADCQKQIESARVGASVISKEELIIQGAELTTKKRKLLDDVNIVSVQIKKWEQDLLEFSQRESILTFEISTTPEELETLGQSGVFQIKNPTEYESITRKSLDRLCIRFYSMMFSGFDPEEIEKFGKAQSNAMWNDREVIKKTVIERTYGSKNPKKSTSKKPKIKKEDGALPSTYEDFMNLEIGKSFEAAIKQSNLPQSS